MRLDLQKETYFIYNFGPYCLKLSTQLNKTTKQSIGSQPAFSRWREVNKEQSGPISGVIALL